MGAVQVVNTDEGWKEDGHPLVGQRVIRIFPEIGVSYGRITKWLPADEDAGDDSLFHVLHDADGEAEAPPPSWLARARA